MPLPLPRAVPWHKNQSELRQSQSTESETPRRAATAALSVSLPLPVARSHTSQWCSCGVRLSDTMVESPRASARASLRHATVYALGCARASASALLTHSRGGGGGGFRSAQVCCARFARRGAGCNAPPRSPSPSIDVSFVQSRKRSVSLTAPSRPSPCVLASSRRHSSTASRRRARCRGPRTSGCAARFRREGRTSAARRWDAARRGSSNAPG